MDQSLNSDVDFTGNENSNISVLSQANEILEKTMIQFSDGFNISLIQSLSENISDILSPTNIEASDESLTMSADEAFPGRTVFNNCEDQSPPIEGYDPRIERMGHIAYGIVAPVIISFGVVSNVLNLVVLSRPSLRGPTFR